MPQRVAYASANESFDTTTEVGRLILQVLGALRSTSRRRSHDGCGHGERADAEQGRPHAGGKRAFGYGRDGVTLIPEEADLLREALAGSSMVKASGRSRGTGTGGPRHHRWQRLAVRDLLSGPSAHLGWPGCGSTTASFTARRGRPCSPSRVTPAAGGDGADRSRRLAQRRSVARNMLTGIPSA